MLAIRFCVNVSQGKPWIGFTTTKSSVMYLQLELPGAMLQQRIKKMVVVSDPHEPLHVWTEPTIKIDLDDGYKRIKEMVAKYHPKVLVIDPIYKIMSGDMLDTRHVQNLVDMIDKLIEEEKVSIMLVHHTRKGVFEESGSDDMLGSVIFSAWADSIIKVIRRKDKEVDIKFDVVRHAQEEIKGRVMKVDLDTLEFTPTGRTI